MLQDLQACYRMLDLEPGATPEEVKRSYRELVQIWHQDRFEGDARLRHRAQEKLKEINLAYERIGKEAVSGSGSSSESRGTSNPGTNHREQSAGRSWSTANSFVNTLGMKFVPVRGADVLFSIWETRVQDYAAYARAASGVNGEWQKPGFAQEGTHPVVNVSWEDARKFATWLTEKERREGRLTAQQGYRLPTDVEWSRAVGLASESGTTPEQRDGKIKDVCPWGTQWPPPLGAGNYDRSLNTDSFEYTSPVASFAANQFGLFDLGGNVWEWCEDFYDGSSGARVLRGASWRNRVRGALLSSRRDNDSADDRRDCCGFRLVLVGVSVR